MSRVYCGKVLYILLGILLEFYVFVLNDNLCVNITLSLTSVNQKPTANEKAVKINKLKFSFIDVLT